MSNFQEINDDESDIYQLQLKMEGTSSSGLKNLINTNTNTNTSQGTAINGNSTNITNLLSQTSGVGTSGLKTLINTNISNINSITTLTNTHEVEITALQNQGSGLFSDMVYFKINTPKYYDMVGSSHGAITGSELSSFELTSDEKRFVIGDLGIVQDTFSPNDYTITESGTKISFGWTSNNVLVFYKMEHYDNSAGNRTLTFGMYDDHHNTNKFSIRHDVYMDSSSFRFKHISGFAGTIAIQNYANYYFWAKSNGGGKLQSVQFFLVRASKNF